MVMRVSGAGMVNSGMIERYVLDMHTGGFFL